MKGLDLFLFGDKQQKDPKIHSTTTKDPALSVNMSSSVN